MARTAIPLYVTNQLITAAHGNTYWRDNEVAHWAGISKLQLPISAGILPISGIDPMALSQVESTAGAPKANWRVASADDTTDEWLQWEFLVPPNFVSGPILWVYYYSAAAIAGDVVFCGRVAASTDGDAGIPAKAYDAVNTATTTVPGVAGTLDKAIVTLTNDDSMAADDFCNIGLYRDADDAGDTLVGDAIIKYVFLVYN